MNIVCFGDSITAASGFAEGDRWPTILQGHLDAWRPGEYKVYNRGIGGNTSAQGYSRFHTDVAPFMPGVVLVEFGFNDAGVRPWSRKSRVGIEEFKANLRDFAYGARVLGGECVFIVNHTHRRPDDFGEPMGNGKTYAQSFRPYNPAIRAVAKATRRPLIDLPKMMREPRVDLDAFLRPDDKLHLSPEGNHVYAQLVFDRLKDILRRKRG